MMKVLIICAVSFVFHYIWERLQCVPFFIHHDFENFPWPMFRTALGDVILTLITYTMVSFASASWDWFTKKWTPTQWIVIYLTALVLSMYIEVSALYQGKWGYTTLNPLLPGTPISLIPIIQFFVLFPLTFYVSAKIISKIQ